MSACAIKALAAGEVPKARGTKLRTKISTQDSAVLMQSAKRRHFCLMEFMLSYSRAPLK